MTVDELTDDEREEFEERAAILEFMSGYSRKKSEKEALRRLEEKRRR